MANVNRWWALAFMGLVGCGGANAEGGGGKTVLGAPIDKEKVVQIKKGESTKDDVQRLMGKPFKQETRADAPPECSDTWTYTHGVTKGNIVHVDVVVLMFTPSGVVCATAQDAKDTPLKN